VVLCHCCVSVACSVLPSFSTAQIIWDGMTTIYSQMAIMRYVHSESLMLESSKSSSYAEPAVQSDTSNFSLR